MAAQRFVPILFLVTLLHAHGSSAESEVAETVPECTIPSLFANGYTVPGNETHVAAGGVVEYFCNPGFRRRGTSIRKCVLRGRPRLRGVAPRCLDVDECKRRPCHKFSRCVNNAGSYSCVCKNGYTGDGKTCTCDFACGTRGKGHGATCIASINVCDGIKHCANGEDEWNCPTPRTTTSTKGCEYNGNIYPPGSEISSGKKDRWCYWTYCTLDGDLISGDDFECDRLPPNTPMPPTGCFYDNRYYPRNSQISSGTDGKWCYWTMCDSEGNVVMGDDFDCIISASFPGKGLW